VLLGLALGIPVVRAVRRITDMREINALFPKVGKACLLLSIAMAVAFFV
jgi:hypothetical protein